MEYEFIYNSITGSSSAVFSMEHEIMGPWLEVEVGNDLSKIKTLLNAVDNIKERQTKDISIHGVEYTTVFSEDSVAIYTNSQLEGENVDLAIEDDLNTDFDSSAECGVEDFKAFLINWLNFIKKPL
jgi:uncharacterized protein